MLYNDKSKIVLHTIQELYYWHTDVMIRVINKDIPNGKYFWEEEYSFPSTAILLAIMLIRLGDDNSALFDISPSIILFHTVSINILSGCPAQ